MNGKLKESRRGEFSVHAASIQDANGHISDSAEKVDDFTEMVEIQERLESALLEAEKASFAKDIFLTNINHELRTPMNCIMGFSELAMEGNISPQTREYLDRIIENTERLLRIIDNIPYISKTVTFNTLDMANEAPGKASVADRLKRPVFMGNVLVCENNRINQRVIVEHLARVGLNAEIAENGRDGVEKVKKRIKEGEKPFDMILMDIHMPVMDGIEAGQKIIELGSGAPVVAMTAGTGRDREFYKTLGMDDCIGKPFAPQELWRCLTKYVNNVSFEKDKNEDTGEKLQNRLNEDYVKSDQARLDEIAGAVEAGDITLARRLAQASGDTAGLNGKAVLNNASASIKECASTHFYRAVFRITLGFLDLERVILDDLFAKAAAR